jgi:uncharacterized protein YebE (UPF0316 family)
MESEYMEWFVDFMTATPWWELLIIFIFKVVEISISTVRIIIVNRGYKKEGAILSFIEVLIWVFVASVVIANISEAPLKGIIYALGYSVGVFLGSIIEKRLAFGQTMLQIIVDNDVAKEITTLIRSKKVGVTTIDAQGASGVKMLIIIYINRKNVVEIKQQILAIEPAALIAENNVDSISGGTILKQKRGIRK